LAGRRGQHSRITPNETPHPCFHIDSCYPSHFHDLLHDRGVRYEVHARGKRCTAFQINDGIVAQYDLIGIYNGDVKTATGATEKRELALWEVQGSVKKTIIVASHFGGLEIVWVLKDQNAGVRAGGRCRKLNV
jgi:hypothetical protein